MMRIFRETRLSYAAFATFVSLSCGIATMAAAADDRFVIRTGGKGGVYYQAGKALCDFIKDGQPDFRCVYKSSKGPRENFSKLRSENSDVIVVRSDWAQRAVSGTEMFSRVGADRQIRSLFSLHGEPLTIVARQDANISNLDDLAGKRLNIGVYAPELIENLIRAQKWGPAEISKIRMLNDQDQAQALCNNDADAVLYITGHPSHYFQKLFENCAVNMVTLKNPQTDRMVARYDELSKLKIPVGYYDNRGSTVETFGFRATVLTRANVSDQTVYELVKSTFENLDRMRASHPAWTDLEPTQMIRDSLVAPLHPGAITYYRERGWLD